MDDFINAPLVDLAFVGRPRLRVALVAGAAVGAIAAAGALAFRAPEILAVLQVLVTA